MHLAELAMEFALEHLKPSGSFLAEAFLGRRFRGFLQADAQPFYQSRHAQTQSFA